MSRSRKHVPIWGIAGNSEKKDKRIANLRRLVKEALAADREPPILREVSDVWVWSKDGKCYWREWWNERPWEVWGK